MRRSIAIFYLFPMLLAAQSWQVFDMDNAGLPSNSVRALVQDQAGVIWAGTDWGLCRFADGEWSVIQVEDGLPDNSILSLAVDGMDRLWVGTALNGIGILDQGEWTYMTIDDPELPDNSIMGITHDHRGWTWICTSGGLACITDEGWRIYDNTADSHMGFELFSPNVRQVAVREDGLVTVATMNGGLTYITEEDFIYFTTYNSNFFDNSANAVVLDSNGDRWLASAAAGLIRHAGPYEGGPWFNYDVQNSGFPDNTLTSLVIDQEDNKYAGTETGGIIVFPANGPWHSLNTQNTDLPDDRILSLMLDAEGILWAGTYEGGVARWDPGTALETAPVGIKQASAYPSPFTDLVWVQWPGQSSFAWEVNDATGRRILHGTTASSAEQVLDLAGLRAGLHTITLRSEQGRVVLRVVKTN